MKKVKIFKLKIVIFTAMKYRCILHGNVCVMCRGLAPDTISLTGRRGRGDDNKQCIYSPFMLSATCFKSRVKVPWTVKHVVSEE